MSDILLSFGVQKGSADVSRMRAELDGVLKQVNVNPPKVSVGLQVDKAALAHFKNQLNQIVNSISLTNGAPLTVSISGIGDVTAKTAALKENVNGVADAMRKTAEAAGNMANAVADANATAASSAAKSEKSEQERMATVSEVISAYKTLDEYIKKNSRVANTDEGKQLIAIRDNLYQIYQASLTSADGLASISKQDFKSLINQCNALRIGLKDAGKEGKTAWQTLRSAYEKFGGWMLVTRSLTTIIRGFKAMLDNVVSIDSAMTELKKVTNETDVTYNNFLTNASSRAKQIGTSIADVVAATADFARLGYGIDDASRLADAAIVYKNVGDGIDDINQASESVISTMQAFGIEASNAMVIVDKFNEVGNNYAISSVGIGDALQRSAAAMASANNTLDETIALITAANTIVQNPDSVGTTLKTVSMFLRAAKTEVEEAGESTDGMADSVSELRDELLDLTGGKVDIQIDEDNFKSTYQILKELSEVWDEITDVSQANILELVGGKRNANVVSALLENFNIAEKALETSAGAAGSALAENEKYLESISGKLEKFKSSIEAFSVSVIDSTLVKHVVDFGTGLFDVLTTLQRIHALMPLIAASVAVVAGAKNMSALAESIAKINTITNAVVSGMKERGTVSDMVGMAVANLTSKEKALVIAQIESAVASRALTSSQASQAMATLGLASSEGVLATANKGLAASFKSLMASIPVWGWVALIITGAIELVTALSDAIAQNKQEIIDNANTAIDSYESANSTYQSNISSLEGLRARFEKLSKGVDENGERVSLTADEYEEYLSLVQQICNVSPGIVHGYDNEGRAIVNYKTLLDDAIASQEVFIKNERNMYLGNGKDIFTGKAEEYRKAQDELADKASNFANLFNPMGFWESFINPDGADKIKNAYMGVFEQLGIDAAKAFNIDPVYDELFKIYENHDQIIAMLGDTGAYTQNEINDISNAIYGLAGAYTTLNSVEGEQVDYLMEWVKDKDWYNSIPLGALDEMRAGIAGVNDPLLSFNENLYATEQYGKAFADAIQSDAVKSIISMSDGLSDGSVSIESYNAAVAGLMGSWGGNTDVLPMIVAFLYSLTNGYISAGSAAESAADKIASTTDELATNFSALQEELNVVNSAISEQATNGSITLETYNALIAASGDYASCIEFENGYMQLNVEKARELIDAKTQLQILELEQAKIDEAENYKSISQALEDAADSDAVYRAALEAELEVSGQLIQKYRVMQSELAETLSAYNKWKAAQNDPESGDMYDDTITALEQIQEGLESGKVGTAKFEAAVELLIPEANRNDVSTYVESLKRYISEDVTGVSNFISDAITQGLMVDDGSGNITIVSDATIQDFCDKLKITPSMAQAIFGELEEYGWELEWTDEDFIGAVDPVQVPTEVDMTALAALQDQLADYRAQLAALENNPLTLQADVTALEEKIAITEQAIIDAGGVVPVDTTAAEGSLQAVQEDLDQIAEKADTVAAKVIGGMGAGETVASLQAVINKLTEIDSKTISDKHYNVYQHTITDDSGASSANGTSSAKGGRTLVGELGPELVVSDDRYYIVGSNGAEFVNLKPGDMVFNHVDTKKIMDGKEGVRGQALWMGTRPAQVAINDGGGGGASKTITDIVAGAIAGAVTAAAQAANEEMKKSGISGGGKMPPGGFSGGNHNLSGSAPESNSKGKKKKESWFEREYKDHQHLLAMDQESVDEYLKWLEEAYRKAYEEGLIDLDEYYEYQEEVYKGIQDQFKDHINDIDHEISMLEAGVGNSDEIINLSLQAMKDIEDELAAARAAGLDENSDYIQWLEQQWMSYSENVTSMRERAEAEAQSTVDNLVEYRIKMLKQEIQDQKDALSKQLKDLQDFYDKQRKMLQDQYDEEKYLEEQKEKRKSVTDIRSELAMLENDNSAWAQKRKLELQAELAEAEKDLNSFERDHALDVTLGVLDEQQAAQEAQIQAQMDALDEKLNDPHALFNQALEDIKNNTSDLYQQFIDYNRKHGTGNDQDIADMWEEAHIADLEYQDTHNGEHKDGIEIGNYTGYVAPETPAPKASDPPPDPKPEPEEPQLTAEIKEKVAAAIWNGKYGWGSGSTRTKRLTEVFGANNGIQDLVSQGVGKSGVSLTDEYTYKNMRKKFKGYKSGTDNATPGWHKLFEGDLDEYVFTSSDGNKYRMFSGLGDKVLNGEATDFLYNFANSGGTVLTNMLADLLGRTRFGNVDKPIQAVEIYSGDIIVQGNASERTVSEIRRAQRDNLEFVLKELNRLNK